MDQLFEHIFTTAYRYLRSYYLAWIVAAVCYRVMMLLLGIEMIKRAPVRRIHLSETESMNILQTERPYIKRSASCTDSFVKKAEVCLSIIVPAYNAEKYVEECIQSVLEQKTQYEYELLIINDGSTDSTQEKVNRYNTLRNVRIFTQENAGFSGARNRGLDLATGQYILFLDSDDRLSPGAIEALLSEAVHEKADIVEGKFKYFRDADGVEYEGAPLWNKKIIVDLKANSERIMNIRGFTCMKVFARHLWDGVRFPLGLCFEDTIIMLVIFRRARNYIFIPYLTYEYRQHDMSATVRLRGTHCGIDSFYVVLHAIEENRRLSLNFDAILYCLILRQFGSILYHRTSGQSPEVIAALLVMCRKVLVSIDEYSPAEMDYYSRCLKQSILTLDIKMWERCCDPFFLRMLFNRRRKNGGGIGKAG